MLAGKETHDNYVTNVASRICVDDFWDSSSSMQHCAAETAHTGGFLQKQATLLRYSRSSLLQKRSLFCTAATLATATFGSCTAKRLSDFAQI
jgi:hypothetical protein